MKKTFAAAAALLLGSTVAGSAADMAMKAAPYAPAPVASWTGFYIGAHVGAGWGTTETNLTGASIAGFGVPLDVPFAQNSGSGFLGGGQVGYNFQSGWAVFGVQGDFAGMDVKGTAPCLVVASCTTKSDWLATVSGRFGGVVADRALIYAKGGAAWMNSTHSVNLANLGGLLGPLFAGQQLTSTESTSWGWLVGLGAEYMITQNWTAFIEYNYIEFDKKNEANNINTAAFGFGGPLPAIAVNADFKNKLSIAKVGVNYKF
jgi:outer membrane immunogenic protein